MSSPPAASWIATLGRGTKWLAGIVVVALVGALVSILVPRLFGPEELAVELSRVSIQPGMTLEEYAIRQQDPRAANGERTAAALDGAAATLLISAPARRAAAAEETAGAVDPARATSTPTPPATTPTPDPATTTPTTTTPPPPPPPPPPTTTTTAPSGDGEDPVVRPKLSNDAKQTLSGGLADALQAAPQPLVVTARCRDNPVAASCGLSSLATAMDATAGVTGTIDVVSRAEVARRLTKVFRGTRTVRSPEDPRKRELVGAAVRFKLALTGFRGRRVQVRWSLYSAKQGVRVPRDWLYNQRILLLRGEADRDSASGQFWVPIPQLRGPFFIRIGVYDDKRGGELDFADTDTFR